MLDQFKKNQYCPVNAEIPILVPKKTIKGETSIWQFLGLECTLLSELPDMNMVIQMGGRVDGNKTDKKSSWLTILQFQVFSWSPNKFYHSFLGSKIKKLSSIRNGVWGR